MGNRILFALLAAALWPSALSAQSDDVGASSRDRAAGLSLESLTLFGGYYSVAPIALGVAGGNGSAVPTATSYGAATSLSYSRFGERSNLSIMYLPSYVVERPGLRDMEHSLALYWRRKATPRWTYSLSAVGQFSSMTDVLFQPSALSNVATTPGSAADLSSAVVTGSSASPDLTQAVNTAAAPSQAMSALIYGGRYISALGLAEATYAWSSRLSINVTGSGTRMQPWRGPSDTSTGSAVPHTDAFSGGVALRYAWDPRTQVGGELVVRRVHSFFDENVYTTSGDVTLARVMGEHWFMQMRAGVGKVTAFLPAGTFSGKPQPEGAASIGFRTSAHTLLASIQRTAGDTYGVGAASSLEAGGAWTWDRPNGSWWTTVDAGEEFLGANGAFARLNSWRADGVLGRRLGGHFAVITQYAYLNLTGRPGVPNQHSVRLMVAWLAHGGTIR